MNDYVLPFQRVFSSISIVIPYACFITETLLYMID